MNSINQPWAIAETHKTRYGSIWANIDFIVNDKISNYKFTTDPLDTIVGTLNLCRKQLPMRYKQLLSSTNLVTELSKSVYFEKRDKNEKFQLEIGHDTFFLKKHELGRLSETLKDSIDCIKKSYQLGLYL